MQMEIWAQPNDLINVDDFQAAASTRLGGAPCATHEALLLDPCSNQLDSTIGILSVVKALPLLPRCPHSNVVAAGGWMKKFSHPIYPISGRSRDLILICTGFSLSTCCPMPSPSRSSRPHPNTNRELQTKHVLLCT